MKDTKELLPTHIHQFKGRLAKKKRAFRNRPDSSNVVTNGFVYSTMIRLKAYIKRLSERGYLDSLKPSDIPINKVILQKPTYLTKEELKKVVDYLDGWVSEVEKSRRKYKRDWKYPAYMARALVRMLYTT